MAKHVSQTDDDDGSKERLILAINGGSSSIKFALVEAFGRRLPDVPQVACFDTAFHRNLPTAAKLLPIPRRFFEAGVRRYGFHGLSFTYLLSELQRIAPRDASGRVIFAHLGSGA